LRQHLIDDRARAVVDTFQINVDNTVKLLLGHVLQLCISDNAGVVDEAIDTAPLLDRHRDQLSQSLGIAHIDHVSKSLSTLFLTQLHRVFDRTRRHIAHHDLGALPGKFDRSRLPDTPASSGNDCNLIL
jgi:hypothetical protein